MHVRLSTLCVTVSLCLLAQAIILFSISCMHLELCAQNIFVSHLLSLCPVHVLYVFLSLTLSHKKSSLRGSVAQTADGNKQGAEPLGHPYHLVGLTDVAERDSYRTAALPNDTVKISANTIDTYRSLVKHMKEENFVHHTYQIKTERAYRIVIRYLHHSVPLDDIKENI